MKTKKIRIRQGFTIVELVIVIGVVGVLAAVLIPTFISLNSKANRASDESLIKNLNTALAMQEQDPKDTKNVTMHDAVLDLKEYGYSLPNLVAKSEDKILWNQKTNRFVFESDDKGTYKPLDFWRIQDSVKGDETFSIYAGLNFKGNGADESIVNVAVSFDAGENAGISSVNYTRTSGPAQEVVIRTNNEATTLTINGYVNPSNPKDGDVVAHYGAAGALSVIKCAIGSYHENGKVGFAEINTGRIVLEQKSEIEHIHINKKDANSFDKVEIKDNGTEKLPSSITRDEISVPAESSVDVVTVIASTGAEETVKVYGSTATGSTQKTETQNTDVNSILGGLVLDNGDSSDKALNNNAKQEVKDEVASESVTAEFEKDPANANFVARIGQTGYLKIKDAIDAATDGKTVVLLKDVEFEGISGSNRLFITHNIILDGNNHTVTAHGRGFGIGTSKVTFKNVIINNPDNGARCIDTRGGTGTVPYPHVEELNLINVVLSTPGSNGWLQPLTIGGNQTTKVKINIDNCELKTSDNGNTGYTIITFNPVDLTIRDSKISGWSAIYMKGIDGSAGSAGSTVKVYDSELYSFNKYKGSSDNFGTIVLEDADIDILLQDCKLTANTEYVSQSLIVFSAAASTICSNSSVLIQGNGTTTYGTLVTNGAYASDTSRVGGEGCSLEIKGGTFTADPTDYVDTEHYQVTGSGPYTVSAK